MHQNIKTCPFFVISAPSSSFMYSLHSHHLKACIHFLSALDLIKAVGELTERLATAWSSCQTIVRHKYTHCNSHPHLHRWIQLRFLFCFVMWGFGMWWRASMLAQQEQVHIWAENWTPYLKTVTLACYRPIQHGALNIRVRSEVKGEGDSLFFFLHYYGSQVVRTSAFQFSGEGLKSGLWNVSFKKNWYNSFTRKSQSKICA